MTKNSFLLLFFITATLIFTGCNPISQLISSETKPTETIILLTQTPEVSSTSSATTTFTSTVTATATNTASPTVTPSATFTLTPTFTPIPTYAIIRGEVNVAHVSCFYGPNKSYLYKYGLVGGSNLEIIGQNADTNYIEVQAIGGDNPCWMNLEWMNVKGDINTVKPIDPAEIILPQSPYYGPVTGVSAKRNGEQVVISWNYLAISPGKDSLQYPYLIESWICSDGQLQFLPVGSWQTSVTIIDEPGCLQPSHAKVYGVEKHGYTLPVEIPWPAPD